MNVIDQETVGRPDRLPSNRPATPISRVPVVRPEPHQGTHHAPSRRKRWLSRLGSYIGAATLVAAGAMVASSPANAGIARCNTTKLAHTGAPVDAYIYMPASSDPYWSINCYMNRGETGSEVKALQSALNMCYGKSLAIDGQFGPRTQAALAEAQRSHGFTTGLGRYTDREAWALRFWGAQGVHFLCTRMVGPVFG